MGCHIILCFDVSLNNQSYNKIEEIEEIEEKSMIGYCIPYLHRMEALFICLQMLQPTEIVVHCDLYYILNLLCTVHQSKFCIKLHAKQIHQLWYLMSHA